MKHNILTSLKAKHLAAGKHADGQGLWLVKRDKAHGKWVQRVVVYGKRREMGLGRWPDVSIVEARERAAEARKVSREGGDPVIARAIAKTTTKPLTFREAVEGCFEARKTDLKGDGEAGRWMSPLTVHVLPKIGSYPVEKIDQHVLKDLLAKVWNDKPDTAIKALNRIGLALRHAAALGVPVDLQATMKTRALLGKPRKTTEHIPSMPYEDTPAFYRSLTASHATSALALRFMLLTLARTTEVRLAAFNEVSGDLWNLSGERTKTGIPRRVPLVPEALRVVALCRETSSNEFLFPALRGKPITDMAMSKLMKDRGLEARPHGFRATFRTWAEEQTDADYEVKEAALGHVVDSNLVSAYQRSDRYEKRRALLQKWEQFLLS